LPSKTHWKFSVYSSKQASIALAQSVFTSSLFSPTSLISNAFFFFTRELKTWTALHGKLSPAEPNEKLSHSCREPQGLLIKDYTSNYIDIVNATGKKYVSQAWKRPLTFLFCPSSSWPVPRTAQILFNNVLLLQITSVMAMAFISLALFLWHYNVQYSCGIWSSTLGLVFLLGAFCGLWYMVVWAVFIQQIILDPVTYCIPPHHCPKVDVTGPVSLFVVH